MLGRSSRSRNFFKKLVVNGVSNSKTAIRNDCLKRLYDADAELKAISQELDSFDGKKDPVRCNLLVNQLRTAQDKVISLLFQLMDECNCERASRDYRMKFPDEILLSEGSESLNGQIWFGAECLSAGSNILNHTKESTMLRPMAKTLTTHLDSLRNDLRELVIEGGGATRINHALIKKMVAFDHIFATFEYQYVRTMLPIRTVAEIEKLQEVAVLFSETLIDCVRRGLTKQDDIDEFQPIVMIAIPRLSIVRGLLYRHDNPIYTKHKSHMCSLFQPFHGPLHSIRRLLRALSPHELLCLEKMLANDQTAIEDPLGFIPGIAREVRQGSSQDKPFKENDEAVKFGGSSASCNDLTEPGTSHNAHPNDINQGLEYPIGQKSSFHTGSSPIRAEAESLVGEQSHTSNCYLDTIEPPTSSSKLDPSSSSSTDNTPSSSSSVSSSLESKPIIQQSASGCPTNGLDTRECDKNCCLSQPENDPQLDRLVAEFRPCIDPQSTSFSQNNCLSNQQDTKHANEGQSAMKELTRSSSSHGPAVIKSTREVALSEDEVNLEEIFQKQTQQLLHRLFVAISGVADQLQSNFASDLRFILRHVFNTDDDESQLAEGELDAEDEVDEDYEQQGTDESDRSSSELPVEQGIEAQEEEANLIDLESGCSVENPFENDPRYMQPMSSQPFGPLVGPSHQAVLATNNRLVRSESLNDRIGSGSRRHQQRDDRIINVERGGMTDPARITGDPIYDQPIVSPNEPSIMDDQRHRQQLLQQHLQSISARPVRSSSRSHRRIRHESSVDSSNVTSSDPACAFHSGAHHTLRNREHRRPSRPIWVPDEDVVACLCCNAPFTWFRRRHHCRACGQIFCAECSRFTGTLRLWGYNGPVRVCESCFVGPVVDGL